MKRSMNPRVIVIFNRDFEGAEADPENKAREDIKGIAEHLVEILDGAGLATGALGVTGDVFGAVVAIKAFAPDVVFNLCESIGGDNRFEPLLPLLLDREGIAYTGSGPLTLGLSLHKHKAKEILRARGVPTPAAAYVTASDQVAGIFKAPDGSSAALPFPLIVKPAREDASVGIHSDSVVHDRAALARRVTHVLSHYRQPALVERYVEGREIYVSMLGRPTGAPQIFPFYEIDFSLMPPDRPRIVSFDGKWVEGSDEFIGTKPVPCVGLPTALQARITEVALAAFEAMEVRDYARLDVRLPASGPDAGTPFVIDVNPNCDLSDGAGGYSKAAAAAGLGYDEVIRRIVDLALLRRPHADTIPLAPRSRAARRDGEAPAVVPATRGGSEARAPRRRARSG
ncbi:MAG TPA: D-alanine--D-alanine ligase [Polyangia bacterium]|nr:D-alanine--D-alanine ligase [Polyangia bacterium]